MKKAILAGAIVAATAFPAAAQVDLKLNQNVDLLVVNGKEYSRPMFDQNADVVLPDGTQQIAFRYVTAFRSGKNQTNFESDVIVAKFDATDTSVSFKFPEFRRIDEAKAFNKDPQWGLVNGEGEAIGFTQGKLINHGVQIGRDLVSELSRFNAEDHPASLHTVTITLPDNVGNATTPVTVKDGENVAEEMLLFWYNKADDATKARFKAYVNQN